MHNLFKNLMLNNYYLSKVYSNLSFIKRFGYVNNQYRRSQSRACAYYTGGFQRESDTNKQWYIECLKQYESLYNDNYVKLFIRDADYVCEEFFPGIIGYAISKFQQQYGFLPDLIYFDEKAYDSTFRFKSDYSKETLDVYNYIGDNVIVRRELVEDETAKQWEDKSSLDRYKLIYKICKSDRVLHVPALMLTNTKPCQKFVQQYVQIELEHKPLVSILIPNKDNIDTLKTCIESIINKVTYSNYEIVIVENNSTEKETFEYYEELTKDSRIICHTVQSGWNYSKINNLGYKACKGEYILFLNNDVEVISEDFIEQMLFYAMKKDVGAVGAKLLFPDGTIQHAGVTLGIRGVAGHAFHGWNGDSNGYENRISVVQNQTAVTAACMMVPRDVFDEVGHFDELLAVAFNDVDLCMKIRSAGYKIIYTPFARLYHYESKSRGEDNVSKEKLERFNRESMRFQKRWIRQLLDGDPYYNKNLSLDDTDFNCVEDYLC